MPPPIGRIQVVHPYYKIVKGVPAAVVRSYKEPLYDSENVLAANPAREFTLYSKPIGQTLNSTTVKTFLYTNQTQASTLGTPLSFDVYGFNKRIWGSETVKSITKGNFDLVEAAGHETRKGTAEGHFSGGGEAGGHTHHVGFLDPHLEEALRVGAGKF